MHYTVSNKHLEYGFKRKDRSFKYRLLRESSSDGNLYYIEENGKIMIVVLYVNDLFVTGDHLEKIEWLNQELCSRFDMTSLASCSKYLGLQMEHTNTGFYLHQADYAQSIVHDFDMTDCNPSRTSLPARLTLQKDTCTSYVNPCHYQRMVSLLHCR